MFMFVIVVVVVVVVVFCFCVSWCPFVVFVCFVFISEEPFDELVGYREANKIVAKSCSSFVSIAISPT